MSQVHTIVVRFADGVVPRYSAATEFQGGQVVAVDFDGNRLRIAQELEEALDELVAIQECCDETGYVDGEGFVDVDASLEKARTALAKARGES